VFWYAQTLGLEANTFGNPRPYSQVLLVFAFWLLMSLAGLGIALNHKKGLGLELIGLGVAWLPVLSFLFFSFSKVIHTSRSLEVNGLPRQMTASESWYYLYQDACYALALALFLFQATRVVCKRLVHQRLSSPIT
jgi:hypothetical protein